MAKMLKRGSQKSLAMPSATWVAICSESMLLIVIEVNAISFPFCCSCASFVQKTSRITLFLPSICKEGILHAKKRKLQY